MTQKYLSEIQSQVDSVPYGELTFTVKRVNRHTTQVSASSKETLRFINNQQAFEGLIDFLDGLVEAGHTGKVQFEVVFQNGTMNLIGVITTEETKY